MDEKYVIVVGMDGTDASRRALLWAVREAKAHNGTVRAVIAWRRTEGMDDPEAVTALLLPMVQRDIDALDPADRDDVTIRAEAIEGRPGQVLADAAREASLLVIGSHGESRAWHQLVGSVAEDCIRLVDCPVVVVPVPHAQRS